MICKGKSAALLFSRALLGVSQGPNRLTAPIMDLLENVHLTLPIAAAAGVLLTLLGVSFAALIGSENGYARNHRQNGNHGSQHVSRLLLVGSPSAVEPYLNGAQLRPYAEVAGTLLVNGDGSLSFNGRPISSLADLVQETVIDEVVVASPNGDLDVQSLAASCAEMGITFRTLVKMPLVGTGRYTAEPVSPGAYLLSMESVPNAPLRLFLKRIMDIVAALAGLLICAVVWLWCGRRIRRETGASTIFRQERVGRHGRRFVLYKFRTMCADAEAQLKDLLPLNEMRGSIFKMRNDPRVTPLGRKLRATYLDELPQFWNVLKGEMSLVGTRPPTPAEVASYQPHHRRRLAMKPGITGLWQLSGNGTVNDFEEIVRTDCQYIDNWSLALDLVLIAKTIVRVLKKPGW